ncbi:hypothetical protein [uncultured Dialister sp.]|nr:hypothetical protein [uncultured Dialister sp.]
MKREDRKYSATVQRIMMVQRVQKIQRVQRVQRVWIAAFGGNEFYMGL